LFINYIILFIINQFCRNNYTLFNYPFFEEVERYADHLRPLTNLNEVMAWSDYGENTTYVRPNIELIVVDNSHTTGITAAETFR